jgi:ribosomal-protein-alanine N-acetyltransferase
MTGAGAARSAECTEPGGPAALLRPEHLQHCLDLDRLCFGGLWTGPQWQRELADRQRPGLGLWREGQLVAMGCAWLIVDELHITLVAVDPAHRRQGLAQGVLAGLLERGRRLGAEGATLEVASNNQAALALYRALGFKTRGVRRRYYSTGEDALIQWLDLT